MSHLDSWTFGELSNTATVSNIGEFDNALNNLTIRLQAQAAAGDSFRKLAVGSVTYGPELFTIYGMMQCTPDLSKDQCSKCLYGTITELRDCCSGRVAARVFFPSCFARLVALVDTVYGKISHNQVAKDVRQSVSLIFKQNSFHNS
ncbi:hypothetical protein QVD17_37951 [Tagetes erecta]|uniref:Gnk2-homologous domain-containing protein n=1 Tax=Tagetes erecta TaxID=13708 RepID=A0AAD8JWX3_TARER|nr:hypothetical protein QVD17_37951 [Tagetes erecta]